jgi:hypothetical protein
MDVIISTANVIPTTAEQVQSFSAWATSKYTTYKEYSEPGQREQIALRIRSNIFTNEMKSIWREAEPYVGLNSTDLHIGRLMLYRKRLEGKIKYMREKLGKLAFPAEATQIRERLRFDAVQRRMERLAPPAGVVITWIPEPFTKVVERLSEEEADKTLECAICMDNHAMLDTCLINCGHRFGAECFQKWGPKHANCPLCRTWCTVITEYTF